MKVMLDECLTRGPCETVKQFLSFEKPPVDPHFLLDYLKQQQGVKDSSWADLLEAEGGWHVITIDRNRGKKKADKRKADGPPLHSVLPNRKITAVFMSGSIQDGGGNEVARAIISVWPDIRNFFTTAERGSKKLLLKQTKGCGFYLRDWG